MEASPSIILYWELSFHNDTSTCVCVYIYVLCSDMDFTALTLWRPLGFGNFREKKHLNARGFAREFLRSSMLYWPSKSLKRRGKSSRLQSKKNFLLGGCRLFASDVISGGLLSHVGPLCLALGANREVVVFHWSFYWKLGYNPSLLILWMTC